MIIKITTKGCATVSGVIKLLKLALVSEKKIYKKRQTEQQESISFLKRLWKCLWNLQPVRKKEFEVTDQLTHANWCNSKCGVENVENFEEHWAKAEPKYSISHLL